MMTRRLTVTNEFGLFTRTAANIVFTVDGRSSHVTLRQGVKTADARSILELMLLGAASGSIIEVTASGEDEELVIAAIEQLVQEGLNGPAGATGTAPGRRHGRGAIAHRPGAC